MNVNKCFPNPTFFTTERGNGEKLTASTSSNQKERATKKESTFEAVSYFPNSKNSFYNKVSSAAALPLQAFGLLGDTSILPALPVCFRPAPDVLLLLWFAEGVALEEARAPLDALCRAAWVGVPPALPLALLPVIALLPLPFVFRLAWFGSL